MTQLLIIELDRAYSLGQLTQMARDANLSTSGSKKAIIRRLLDAGVIRGEVRPTTEGIEVATLAPEVPRELTDEQVRRACKVIFDTVQVQTATVFGAMGQPLVTRFADLHASEREQAFQGLKDRVHRETLSGYVQRKRADWGDRATDAVIWELKRAGLL